MIKDVVDCTCLHLKEETKRRSKKDRQNRIWLPGDRREWGRTQVLLRRKENKDVFCHTANNYTLFKTCYDVCTKRWEVIKERATKSLSVVSGRLHPFDEVHFDLRQLTAYLCSLNTQGTTDMSFATSLSLGSRILYTWCSFLGTSYSTTLKCGRWYGKEILLTFFHISIHRSMWIVSVRQQGYPVNREVSLAMPPSLFIHHDIQGKKG